MVTGIVLVSVERAMINDVIDGLMKLKGVSEVYSVAGEYDLVAMIRQTMLNWQRSSRHV